MEYLNVSNIQRVCFHDGPGIRTTIFLYSCSLTCPWCANPETSRKINKYIVNNKCMLKCNNCLFKLDCKGNDSPLSKLEVNYTKCPVDAIEEVYKRYSIEELYNIIKNDYELFNSGGGITFSGGEPILQSKSLIKLIKMLKKDNINIAVETCLFVNDNNLLDIIDYIDWFIIDIKVLDKINCKKILNGNIDLFFKNIELIFKKKKNVIFRIPLIKAYITNEKNLDLIYKFLDKYIPKKVEIFKGHNLAKEKYKKFNLQYDEVKTISDDEINFIKEKIQSKGINVEFVKF